MSQTSVMVHRGRAPMTANGRKRRRGLVWGVLLTGLSLAWVLGRPSPAFAGQAPQKAGYVGIASCNKENCHSKEAQAYLTGPHGRKGDNGAPSATDECESCHGPGQAHMANPKEKGIAQNLEKIAARESSQICLSCHETGDQATFVESMHARRNVACVSCHSMHKAQSKRGMLKTAIESETCFQCHKSERAMTLRTSHHPVREGKIGCPSCHNPHDGTRPKMLQAESVNELCYKCHTEKRGPFLYEHAAVREDCASCHQPHGSNHARLLLAKVPYVCQGCHYNAHGQNMQMDFSNTETGGVPVAAASPANALAPNGSLVAQVTRSSRGIERSCINCHLAIHGSNSASGQFFVR